MNVLRETVVRDHLALLERSADLRAALRIHDEAAMWMIQNIDAGTRVCTFMEADRVADARFSVTAAARAYDKARNRARLSTMALLRLEGMRPAAMARMWGISRQMVAQHLQQWDSSHHD